MRLRPADVLAMGKAMAEAVPAALDSTVADARANGLDHPTVERMAAMVIARAKLCRGILEAPVD